MKRNKSHRLLWRTAADGPGVYVLRNLETGKMYIGATSRPIPERIAEHCRSGRGKVQELFQGTGKVEVVCDVLHGATEAAILRKEQAVGEKLLTLYPGALVNAPHMLGKSPKNICENESHSVSLPQTINPNKMHTRPIVAILPDGTWKKFHGVRFAAAQLGLDNSTISKVLNGIRPHHEGTYFIDLPRAL